MDGAKENFGMDRWIEVEVDEITAVAVVSALAVLDEMNGPDLTLTPDMNENGSVARCSRSRS